jgi:hypothetical protein
VSAGGERPRRANDADRDWDHGRYTRRHREILTLFTTAYPP